MRTRLVALLLGLLVASGCSSVPVPSQDAPALPDHSDLDAFLARHVDDLGRVDYAAAGSDRAGLDRFVVAAASASPDSHPEAFGTDDDRLAYWINSYNAWVIAMVLRDYPIDSVLDAPNPVAWIDRRAGFFFLRRVLLGGDRMSLYTLENGVVRARFDEPRIHFALNCASRGCPRLPPEAFTGPRLRLQLARETARFLAEERNVSVDSESRVVRLSMIFRWYESDFTGWMERHRPDAQATLLAWIVDQAPAEVAERVAACVGCDVEFVPYDWSLNDLPGRAVACATGGGLRPSRVRSDRTRECPGIAPPREPAG